MDMNLEGGGSEGELDFLPLMQGMMENLLSKEVLYPALKDLQDKVRQAVLYKCDLERLWLKIALSLTCFQTPNITSCPLTCKELEQEQLWGELQVEGGSIPIMAFTRRLHPKGVPFSSVRYLKG